MKKSSLALGAIAVLVAAWAGGTWYSGKALEQKYPEYIALANERVTSGYNNVAHGNYHLEIKNTKLERGFFSTQIEDQVIITDLKDNSQLILPFKSTAEHGPLPLSRLTSLKLMPVLADAHSEMTEDPSISEVFKASKGVAPYSGDFSISYSGQIKQNSTIAAFDYSNEQFSINSTPIYIESDTNQEGVGLLKMRLEKWVSTLQVDEFNERYQPITVNRTLTFNNVTLNSDLSPTDFKYVPSGKQRFDIGLISIADAAATDYAAENIELKNVRFDYDTNVNAQFADYRLNNSIEALSINGENFGQIDFNLNLGHLAAAELNQVVEAFTNPDLEQQQAQLNEAGLKLLQQQPTLAIQPLRLKNSAGENQLTFDLVFSKADQQAALMQGKILSLFDKLEMNANVNRQSAQMLMTSSAKLDGIENPEQYAESELNQSLEEAVQQKMLVSNDNGANYQSKLILENGELKLNGEVIPEESIAQTLLFMFMGGF
ncbi:YdgA family protein [Testudinibacter aquarius]|uniref:DUF945 domain-containing protein n=1 Tax=Testudinibacter aquarius TaxID=1524974 RepID=A0A4R3Y7V2_9PAST|nr:YdgA family protein [Testudinibacter aquarius]KAE9525507.1 hypothetical protein A1D24_04290 [Testudinibacter aquarius]TCV87920.1 uncharacterized protein YdgA (DUF945 family) [Testudinibacter aquarius]TNG89600.1 DUF945 domain-containing protein [Testudinibacter aquarius]